MYSRTLLDILFLIWGQTVADYKMLSFHLSIDVIIIVVSFKILDLCPIALFQQLWNTLYINSCSWWPKTFFAEKTLAACHCANWKVYQILWPQLECGELSVTSMKNTFLAAFQTAAFPLDCTAVSWRASYAFCLHSECSRLNLVLQHLETHRPLLVMNTIVTKHPGCFESDP